MGSLAPTVLPYADGAEQERLTAHSGLGGSLMAEPVELTVS